MTTYQDPPLQSRRAARQGERAAAHGQQQPEQAPEPSASAAQNRPPVPQYGGPDFRARRTPEAENGEPDSPGAGRQPSGQQPSGQQPSGQQPVTQLPRRHEMPSHRPRDFSPEGRRVVPDDPQGQPAAQSPSAAVAPDPSAPVEHTMTRRELRALREAQGADLTVQSVAATRAGSEAAVGSAPSAVQEVPAPAAEGPVALIEPPSPSPSSAPAAPELSPFEALFSPPSTPASAAPAVRDIRPDPIDVAPAAEPVAPAAEPVAPAAEPVVEQPAAALPGAAALESVQPESVPPATAFVGPAPAEPAAAPAAPAGHWTTQADFDDATQVSESTISRSVGAGSGVITTSALVLPSLPSPEFGSLGTGEVLVTGSIDLPHSLATSGAHPTQLDGHHLDHELDPGDRQVVSTDSQPVRAVKAISSHGSTRDVIVSKKRSGNRVLTVLIVSAAAMAAVVATLLVVGLVSGVL